MFIRKRKGLEQMVNTPSWAQRMLEEDLALSKDDTHCRIKDADDVRQGEMNVATTGTGYGKVLPTRAKTSYPKHECPLEPYLS